MTEENYGGLTQLGHHVAQPASPEAATLERVPNPSRGRHYVVRFTDPTRIFSPHAAYASHWPRTTTPTRTRQ